jgi:CheY-like chemotaxis protein
VYLDPAQFEHLLMNLAVNARDAMPTGGALTIRTRFPQVGDTYDDGPSRDGLLFLSVSDTGHGMDAAVQARIFDPFFTTRPLGQGSGLGLSMVHGFVEQSGGTIAVDSVPNTGTTFRIGLPVEHAHPFDELQPRDMSRRAAAGTVLVTEDEPAVRALVARTLKDAGYDVLVPDTPAAAIDVCEHYTGTIDLLLTDVVMPGLNGQELASRAAASRPSMRVLFMSGYSETARATVTGCDFAVLEKPFNAASLTRAVRDALMPERETCVTTVTGV